MALEHENDPELAFEAWVNGLPTDKGQSLAALENAWKEFEQALKAGGRFPEEYVQALVDEAVAANDFEQWDLDDKFFPWYLSAEGSSGEGLGD